MRRAHSFRALGRRAGLTLIELMVALTIFSVLGYSLLSALSLSNNSRAAVENMVEENEELRAGAGALSEDLRLSSESRIAITSLADENHQLSLQLPIVVGGDLDWGVPGSDFSAPGAADQEDWLVRYTVKVDPGGADGPTRSLVRQILDDAGTIHEQQTLVHDLTQGTDTSPGFHVEKTGEVWEVTLSTDKGAGKSEVFHVYSRN
jgi:prepilin-type N-terminal cleavage/methylation domain-containing protein